MTVSDTKVKSLFLREPEMAAQIPVPARTLRHWRTLKKVPYLRIGRLIFYEPAKVLEALRRFERLAA
jgi:hypothetical protein